jgi:hypothetical protein
MKEVSYNEANVKALLSGVGLAAMQLSEDNLLPCYLSAS